MSAGSRRTQFGNFNTFAVPAIYERREFAIAGGLMSNATDPSEAGRQTGIYVGRILNSLAEDLKQRLLAAPLLDSFLHSLTATSS